MRLSLQLCLLALLALATCIPNGYPLNVTLTWTGNTAMQMVIQNVGESDLTLVTAGSFFDNRPIKKVTMYSGKGTALAFHGMKVDPKPITALVAADFTAVRAGQALSVTFDAATMYDLSSADTFTAEAVGAVWDARSADFIPYNSNSVEITVHQPKATTTKMAVFNREASPSLTPYPANANMTMPAAILNSLPSSWPQNKIRDCGDDEQRTIRKALSGCKLYADAGANRSFDEMQQSGQSYEKLKLYFNTEIEADDAAVFNRFSAISKECAAIFRPEVFISCSDLDNTCQQHNDTLAYHITSSDDEPVICLCPPAFDLAVASETYNDMDFAGLLLSQHTFFDLARAPWHAEDDEQDVSKAARLSSSKALANSGSYRMYAQSSYLDYMASLDSGSTHGNRTYTMLTPADLNSSDNWNGTDCADASEDEMDNCWDPPDSWDDPACKPADPNDPDNLDDDCWYPSMDSSTVANAASTTMSSTVSADPSGITMSFFGPPSNIGKSSDFPHTTVDPPATTTDNWYCWGEDDNKCPSG
ncbi:deuterolysin metalloprotease [Diplodia corticola]|uniref:deuterolysin n=1 Tax=Diplodia corticola TaxID=236234 RepID=A0A1J9R8X4_9PEZI|nr:deuterolysin metalloprotease [Diplodia corticola]OJD28867.1 deuterolysin metalloprotease [Diplodia corticola]